MRPSFLIALIAAWLLAGLAAARADESGFLDRAVVVAGAEYRYQIYLPRERGAGPLAAILALHGGGQYGSDGISQTAVGLAHAIRLKPERFQGAVVVFPQIPLDGTPGFQGQGSRIALAALDKTIAEFAIDKKRVYLTGLSAGGNGAWYLAYHHTERFAAALIACGFVGEFTGRQSGLRYPPIAPGEAEDAYAEIARRTAKLPIWLFHGEADPTVSVEVSRRMHAALQRLGADVRYTELAGVAHNAWDPAYTRPEAIAWLLSQGRQ